MRDCADAWRLLGADVVETLRRGAMLTCSQTPIECSPREAACLFNIREDPCERRNMADLRPDILSYMEDLLSRYLYLSTRLFVMGCYSFCVVSVKVHKRKCSFKDSHTL